MKFFLDEYDLSGKNLYILRLYTFQINYINCKMLLMFH